MFAFHIISILEYHVLFRLAPKGVLKIEVATDCIAMRFKLLFQSIWNNFSTFSYNFVQIMILGFCLQSPMLIP